MEYIVFLKKLISMIQGTNTQRGKEAELALPWAHGVSHSQPLKAGGLEAKARKQMLNRKYWKGNPSHKAVTSKGCTLSKKVPVSKFGVR